MKAIMALCIGALLVAACGAVPNDNSPVTSAKAVQVNVSRSAALARVTSNTVEFKRIDRIEAKLTSWSSYKTALGDRGVLGGVSIAPSELVWVVAVGGDIRPAYAAPGSDYSWGELSMNSDSGTAIEFDSGNGSSWPPGFDGITDLGSP